MAEYQFSRRAALDLEAIAEYTIARFGLEKARTYRDDMGACFERLADNPRLGRPAKELGPELRRYEHRSHIIFISSLARASLCVCFTTVWR